MPGALYADCSVVRLNLRKRIEKRVVDEKKQEPQPEENQSVDDGEYGGEDMGRLIWESFEASLKAREKLAKESTSPGSGELSQ